MKKIILIVSISVVCSYVGYTVFARGGGDSFLGGFAGGTMGSVVGSAMTRPSGGGGGSHRAMKAIDRLEDMMRRDFERLNNRMNDLEQRIRDLESASPA